MLLIPAPLFALVYFRHSPLWPGLYPSSPSDALFLMGVIVAYNPVLMLNGVLMPTFIVELQ